MRDNRVVQDKQDTAQTLGESGPKTRENGEMRAILKRFAEGVTLSAGATLRRHLAAQKERMERQIPGYKHHYRPN